MSTDLERMLEAVVRLPAPADAESVFRTVEASPDRTLMHAFTVAYDFEMSAGRRNPTAPDTSATAPEPDKGWSQVRSCPVAIIELTADRTTVRPVLDFGRLLPGILAFVGWVACWTMVAAIVRSRRRT